MKHLWTCAIGWPLLLAASGAYALELGNGNDNGKTGSAAIGSNAETKDDYSTAVGNQATTGEGSHRSTAVGFRTTIENNAALSTAVGFDAMIRAGATHSTAVGAKSIIGDGSHHSVAVGHQTSIGDNSVGSTVLGEAAKIGNGSQYSTALGHRSAVGNNVTAGTAVGDFARVEASNGVALGYRATANVANSVALGSGSVANIGAETGYHAYGLTSPQNSVGEIAIGTQTGNRVVTGVAAGSRDTDAVNVRQLKAVDEFAVKYDEAAPGVPDYTKITLGQGAVGDAPVLLRNVRAGEISSTSFDAVNGSQINAISERVAAAFGGGSAVLPDGTISAPSYTIQGATYDNVGSALGALDQAVSRLSSEITSEAGKAGAAGLAASSLRFDDRPGKLSIAAGAGVWNNYGAMAFGAGYTSLDQRFRTNITGVTTGDKWGVAAGVSFTLN